MIPNPDQVARERERHNRAVKGPGFTFLCAGPCGQGRNITGRRRINGKWVCSFCAEASK